MRTHPALRCVVPLSIVFGTSFLTAQTSIKLEESVITENRELDRLLIEAHDQKNTEKVLSVFSEGANTFFIAPNGGLNKGRDAICKSDAVRDSITVVPIRTAVPVPPGRLFCCVSRRSCCSKPALRRRTLVTSRQQSRAPASTDRRSPTPRLCPTRR